MSEIGDVRRIVEALEDPTRRKPARDFPLGQAEVDEAGLYAWFVDEPGARQLSEVFGVGLSGLIYAGQAGATSSKAGVERSATLLSRILRNHLRGNIRSSTFRRTLTAALLQPLGLRLARPDALEPASNEVVSEWMRAHLEIATVACPDRATLAALESAVLQELNPPLNLMGMPPTGVRSRLKTLRRELKTV